MGRYGYDDRIERGEHLEFAATHSLYIYVTYDPSRNHSENGRDHHQVAYIGT